MASERDDNALLPGQDPAPAPAGLSIKVKIGVVITTAGAQEYVRACVESFLATDTQGIELHLLVVDDASPNWSDDWQQLTVLAAAAGIGLGMVHFSVKGGLFRSLNTGLAALLPHCDAVVVSNDDVLVPAHWHQNLLNSAQDFDFVGPLSNAPGVTNKSQDVSKWLRVAGVGQDSAKAVNEIHGFLKGYKEKTAEGPINGFFIWGASGAWRRIAHSPADIFPPEIKIMPSGSPNPTPLLTGGEDWLAYRCRLLGIKMGISVGTYVHHYRSVTRGPKYLTAGWTRRSDGNSKT